MCPTKRSLAVVLGLTVAASPTLSLAQQPDTVPAPMTLLRHAPGEPSWAATFRLREAEARYVKHPQWGPTYCQIRGQSEVWLGNHADALRYFESCGWAWGDSTYVLPPGTHATDAVPLIAAAADTARIVMVNERHHAASDRLLTLRLLSVLRQKGYTYFAAEAFDWADTGLNHRAAAKAGVTGGYVDEPVFGEIVREARRLGYRLVPYEATPEQNAAKDSLNPQQRRDFAQASNLNDRIFRADPNAKVLIHAGFAHVQERPTDGWFPMAWYLRQLTGIDPVTVDQTVMAEASTAAHEHPAYRAAYAAGLIRGSAVILTDAAGRPLPAVKFNAVDLQVATPRTTYTRGRPDWMTLGERRRATQVAVPECATRACVLEVRMSDDPNDAVPIDRTEARAATARLLFPVAGRVRVQVFTTTGELLRAFEPSGDHRASAHSPTATGRLRHCPAPNKYQRGQSRVIVDRTTLTTCLRRSAIWMADEETSATDLLLRAGAGEPGAAASMFPLVYDELRRVAHLHLVKEPSGRTLGTTELVHEAYLRLIDHTRVSWNDRVHFMAVAATAMRHILVDRARSRLSLKRGGGRVPVSLDAADLGTEERADLLVALDEALLRLRDLDERRARVVECRFFGGMTEDETAEALGISMRTAQREWSKAKGWLYRELREETHH